MQINAVDGQVSMFVLDSPAGKTCPARTAHAPPRNRPAATSGRSSSRSSPSRNPLHTLMLLDLRPGAGNMLGSYWEYDPPWLGSPGGLNCSACPKDVIESSLSLILEDTVPTKYYLSRKACRGILRRAKERGKPLPVKLEVALRLQAGLPVHEELVYELTADGSLPLEFYINQSEELAQIFADGETMAFAANQRDEVRDLHGWSGALGAQPGMKQQTFVAGVVAKGNGDCFLNSDTHTALSGGGGQAGQGYPCVLIEDEASCLTPWDTQRARIFVPEGKAPALCGADAGGGRNPGGYVFSACFNAGAGSKAGGISYHEEFAPTLKAGQGGNMMPSVLCLNDQGGGVMDWNEDLSGTLRAQEHGHQPLVLYENHGIDARYTGPHEIAPTMSARYGTGGNNLPLVARETGARMLFKSHGQDADYAGPLDISPTVSAAFGMGGGNIPLVTENRQEHTLFSRQRVDQFQESRMASTESARQHKDATDLVYQETVGALTSSGSKGINNQCVSKDKCVVDGVFLIRRLTPRECERLQGYPDDWTDIPGASDAARYKALGNSVAIPCVEYLMQGIALILRKDRENGQ